jgi:hypothetical protein
MIQIIFPLIKPSPEKELARLERKVVEKHKKMLRSMS